MHIHHFNEFKKEIYGFYLNLSLETVDSSQGDESFELILPEIQHL